VRYQSLDTLHVNEAAYWSSTSANIATTLNKYINFIYKTRLTENVSNIKKNWNKPYHHKFSSWCVHSSRWAISNFCVQEDSVPRYITTPIYAKISVNRTRFTTQTTQVLCVLTLSCTLKEVGNNNIVYFDLHNSWGLFYLSTYAKSKLKQ